MGNKGCETRVFGVAIPKTVEKHQRGEVHASEQNHKKKPEEVAVVAAAYAVVEVHAMVVVSFHAHIAHQAVAHSRESPDVACSTVFYRNTNVAVGAIGQVDGVEVLIGALFGQFYRIERDMHVFRLYSRVTGGALYEIEQRQ